MAGVRKPKLKDESTPITPHSKRWDDLVAYVRKLNEKFPREDLTTLCGLFSTEREFARHIRRIEDRIKAKN